MSVSSLLDHVGNVWRLTHDRGDFGETVNDYQLVYERVDLTFQRRNTVLGSLGPGQKPVGDRRVYLDVGPNFEDRDVVEVIEGPAGFVGPQLLEVESIAVPRGHHVELRCTEFSGELPNQEDAS